MRHSLPHGKRASWPQTLVGAGVLLTGLALGFGALAIPSNAGYGGVGADFLPKVVAVLLTLCGGWILWEARTGGFRAAETPPGSVHGYWPGFVWVSAGLLGNAALITTIGFIPGCALCYGLAVQGLRRAAGQDNACRPHRWLADLAVGVAIAAPVYWTFTQFLAINLPGLTRSGWI